MTDIIDRLSGLHKQATTDRSHNYAAQRCVDAMKEPTCASRRLTKGNRHSLMQIVSDVLRRGTSTAHAATASIGQSNQNRMLELLYLLWFVSFRVRSAILVIEHRSEVAHVYPAAALCALVEMIGFVLWLAAAPRAYVRSARDWFIWHRGLPLLHRFDCK